MTTSDPSGATRDDNSKPNLTDLPPELDETTFFTKILLAKVPEFQADYDAYMAESEGELFPHELMKEFTRFLLTAYRASVSRGPDADLWRNVFTRGLDLLERAPYVADDALFNVIGVSFVEYLYRTRDRNPQLYQAIIAQFGPGLRSLLQNFDPDA